jgi:hypothetical protein
MQRLHYLERKIRVAREMRRYAEIPRYSEEENGSKRDVKIYRDCIR